MTALLKALQHMRSREGTVIAVVLFAVGLFVAWHATSYNLGSLRRMESGYFPLMLGVALCVFAASVFFSSEIPHDEDTSDEEGSLASRLRAMCFILTAMILFATLIRKLGFAPTTALATLVAGLAEPDNGWKDLIALSVFITVFASLVFVVALGVPIPLVAF